MVKAVSLLCASPVSTVTGIINFTQEKVADETVVFGELRDLTPGNDYIFRIHKVGNITNGWKSTGGVFTDLGIQTVDPSGTVNFATAQITLFAENSIIGRSVVIYRYEDCLGRGGGEESLKTEECGPVVAWGVIGVTE